MKHTAAFTAARDALAPLLASPELLDTDPQAVSETLGHIVNAALEVAQGHAVEGNLPAPLNAEPLALLTAARDVLGEYEHRELPAWGSAECAQLLAPLCYANQALELLATLHALSAEGDLSPAEHLDRAAQFAQRAQSDPAPAGRLAHTLAARDELSQALDLGTLTGEPLTPALLLDHAHTDLLTAAQLIEAAAARLSGPQAQVLSNTARIVEQLGRTAAAVSEYATTPSN